MKKSMLVFCSFFALSIFAPAVAQAAPVNFMLTRGVIVGKAVHGKLSGGHECDTLENKNFIIPTGRYQIIVDKSPRFSKKYGRDVFLPHILNVPDRDGMRIHTGTEPDDSIGCVLVEPDEDHVGSIKEAITDDARVGVKSYITIQ